GDVAQAGSLLFMAAQITAEIKARRARKVPSHVAQATPGTMLAPHKKRGAHRDSTQKGAQPSNLPAKDGCGCPPTASAKPVNYAMGDENLEQTDFVLDGIAPIVWTRRYRSSLEAYDASALGALEQPISPVARRTGRCPDVLRSRQPRGAAAAGGDRRIGRGAGRAIRRHAPG
ncbi:DUF6531 domain-containing protein, partial [Burkholderia ubonensis]